MGLIIMTVSNVMMTSAKSVTQIIKYAKSAKTDMEKMDKKDVKFAPIHTAFSVKTITQSVLSAIKTIF